jgi:hypothetical protein
MQQMVLVPGQCAVQQFAAAGPYPAFHDRVRAGYLDAAGQDVDAGVGQDRVEDAGILAVPVRIRYVTLQPASSRSIGRLRAAWPTRAAVGWAVAPRTRMRRLACSITVRMYIRAPVSVTAWRKSAASSACAWERRKSVQVVAARSGAGSSRPDAGFPSRWTGRR